MGHNLVTRVTGKIFRPSGIQAYSGLYMAKPLLSAKRNQMLHRAAQAFGQGDARAAYKSARAVASNDPADRDALIMIAQTAPGANTVGDALRLFDRAVAKAGQGDEDVLICWGNLKAAAGDFASAEAVFRTVLEQVPDSPGASQNLANVLMQNGKPDQAIEVLSGISTGLLDGDTGWQVHLGLANAHRMLGNLQQAEQALQMVLQVRPNHLGALNNLGQILMERGFYEKAGVHLEKALAMQPDHPGVLLNMAALRRRQERIDEALELAQKCLKLRPDMVSACVSLCDILEMSNRTTELRQVLNHGLSRFPDHSGLLIQAARLDRRDGQIDRAIQRLENMTGMASTPPAIAPKDVSNAAARAQELGMLYDKKDQPALAWDYFTRAKQHFSVLGEQRGVSSELFFDEVARMDDFVRRTDFGALPELSFTGGRKPPCFVMGFLRSGTTLLHQILDSHDDVAVVDEKPMSLAAKDVLEQAPCGFPHGIATMGNETARQARQAYFQGLDSHLPPSTPFPVDKFPFNLMRVPLLWRLFPDATFILAVRHPLDVCLSCYMQAFQPSAMTSPFLTMPGTVRAYTALMDMWLAFAEKAPINTVLVRYEDMVAEQDATTRWLLDSTGLPWTDKALRFHENAQQSTAVKNPSYHQVIRPVYNDAVHRWQRYDEHLRPWHGQMAPYLRAFGYSESA